MKPSEASASTDFRKDNLVSIIAPTFNHARYIERCLRTVEKQSYDHWEMIVVDDASTDGTGEIVESFAERDRRFKLIRHKERYGADALGVTYNEALERSQGELIAILEGDDWWHRDRLRAQILPMTQDPDIVLGYADCWEVTESGRPVDYLAKPISSSAQRSSASDAVYFFARLNSVPANTVLVRRDALEGVGGFRTGHDLPVVDYPTWLELSMIGDCLRIPAALGYWRRHTGSVYWQNHERVALGCHRYFIEFVRRNAGNLEAEGLVPAELVRRANDALRRTLSTLPYFDARHELLYGNRWTALRKFSGVLVDRTTTPHHRRASVLGMMSGVVSPRLFIGSLAVRRAMVGRP
jgi:glycosyltransferase involved in cell wall biosynthesis